MPEGEHSWKQSKGPRRTITCRISTEAHLLLDVAAAMLGKSPTALAQDVIERWATDWLEANRDELRQFVGEEKQRRAGGEA